MKIDPRFVEDLKTLLGAGHGLDMSKIGPTIDALVAMHETPQVTAIASHQLPLPPQGCLSSQDSRAVNMAYLGWCL